MLKILTISLVLFSSQMHSTFTGVECFPDKGLINVCIKLNYHDFIFDYRFTIDDDQGFDPSGKIDTNVVRINKYISDKIGIFAGTKKIEGHLRKIETTDGELKMDLVYYYNKKTKQFRIRNTFLVDINKDQSNLLIFKHNEFEEGVKLTPEKTECTFKVK